MLETIQNLWASSPRAALVVTSVCILVCATLLKLLLSFLLLLPVIRKIIKPVRAVLTALQLLSIIVICSALFAALQQLQALSDTVKDLFYCVCISGGIY